MKKRAYLSLLMLLGIVALALAPSGARVSAQSSARSYVLSAAKWGDAQSAAVQAAGGVVTYSHGKSGLATAVSSNPNFASDVTASGAVSSASEDMFVQWVQPVREFDVDASAVTPGNETFINVQWNVRAIEAPAAWAAGFTGQGVRVAVIDGGIWNSHVDLNGSVDTAASRSFVPGFAYNQDAGTFWHGTHVAGIIAARDNNFGTIGVAPGATIIGVKVLHEGTGSFGAVISGILYASTPQSEGGAGADIINMSLGATFPKAGGGGTPPQTEGGADIINMSLGATSPKAGSPSSLIAALNKAVNYAGSNGVLVVSAAGNNGLDLDHSASVVTVPAQSGSGIAVSATGPEGYAVGYPNGATNFRAPASYTNYGNSVINLAAPGGDERLPGNAVCLVPAVPAGNLLAPCWAFDLVLSTSRGRGASTTSYTFAAGTSMAAPVVSGVAALIKQRFPGISLGALKTKLQNTADDEGPKGNDPFYGKGFVNARRAVTE